MLCPLCDELVFRCLQQTAAGFPNRFGFKHGNAVYWQEQALQGCRLCELVLDLNCHDRDRALASGSYYPASFYLCGTRFELFRPGQFDLDTPQSTGPREPHEAQVTSGSGVSTQLMSFQNDLPSKTNSQESFQAVPRWLGICLGHSECERQTTSLPTRVLDITQSTVRLFESKGMHGKYVALSHRWGDNLMQTTSRRVDTFKRDIPFTNLPRTFQDAVILLRYLDIRYLWIDSLCIVQDDLDDWAREASQMASIYSNALFTISATDPNAVQNGLFRHIPGSTYTDTALDGSVVGIRLGAPSFDQDMKNSPLSERGWIYQERILSSAILHCGSQLYWECKAGVMSQGIPVIEAQMRDFNRQFWGLCKRLRHSDIDAHVLWTNVVREYTRRQFTKKSDRYAAILGVASKLSSRMSNFRAGLWEDYLHMELTWCPDAPHSANSELRSPSWSWISVDYPVVPFVDDPDFDVWNWDFRLEQPAQQDVVANIVAYAQSSTTQFELHMQGSIIKPTNTSLTERTVSLEMRCGYSVTILNGSLDPGRSMPKKVYLLRICSSDSSVLGELGCFLLLKRVGIPDASAASLGKFKRIGIGKAHLEDIRAFFESAQHGSLTLV